MPRCEMCGEWPDCPWKTDPEIMCSEYHPKPMTNYDRIISKTPEELAEWFLREPTIGYFAVCPPGTKDGDDCPTSPCEQCWLDWLKSPADKEGEA